MKKNKQKQYKKPEWENKAHEIGDVDDITDEIEATLQLMRTKMAAGDPRDPEAVAEVRGHLDHLVERIASTTDANKDSIMRQIAKLLFQSDIKLPF